MKKLFFIISIFFICSSSNANSYEFLFCSKQNGSFITTSVAIYSYNNETKGYTLIGSGGTLGSSGTSFNGLAYVDGVSGRDKTPTVLPTNRPDSLIDYVDTYLIAVENRYVIIQPNVNGFDAQIYFTIDNDIVSLTASTEGSVPRQDALWSSKTISLRNNFGGDKDYVSGKVYLNGEELLTGYNYVNGYRQDADFPISISGDNNQTLSGNGISYYRKWRKWFGYDNSDLSQTLHDANPYFETAIYARQCNVTIQNDFGSAGSGGTIKFGANTQNSPYQPSLVYDDENYTVEGISQSVLDVDFTFNHWEFQSSNIGSANPKTDFMPTSHGTLKAKFTGKPTNGYRNLHFTNPDGISSPTVNSNIRINWDGHPDSDVNGYQIWRRVKHNGNWGEHTLLTTTSQGTRYYIDYDYKYTDGYTDDMVNYDVRACLYYNSSYSYADMDYETAFAKEAAKIVEDSQIIAIANELPTEYSITNYPNPFNPTTTINYQLPENGFVSLKVYDVLGKEIATLVNGNRTAGYHNVTFDASRLTSGIYIYTITANNFVQSKKMLLMK